MRVVGLWGNGPDSISWLVNLVVSLDRCDREVCIAVALYKYVTLHSMQFVYVYFEATLLVDDLLGVFWDHTWRSGCDYLFALGSFGRDEGSFEWLKSFFVQKSLTSTGFVALWRNVRRVGPLNLAAQQIRRTAAIDGHCKYRVKFPHSERVQVSQKLAELKEQFHVPAETTFSVSIRTTNCSYNQHPPIQTPAHHMMQPPAVPFQYLLTFTSRQTQLSPVQINTRTLEGEHRWPCGQMPAVSWSCSKPLSNV